MFEHTLLLWILNRGNCSILAYLTPAFSTVVLSRWAIQIFISSLPKTWATPTGDPDVTSPVRTVENPELDVSDRIHGQTLPIVVHVVYASIYRVLLNQELVEEVLRLIEPSSSVQLPASAPRT
ncbi:hypothetical protein PNOK_0582600 [Pyrrhoderma noxium]|uniref:Uncharacterized protein n=1 Tax=Pyrrhoderma noxium TaxID=2282107 RepID=A0A286UHA6_9AGAM|nr:hypothetical protein PNOK_0582600 [Pyrrhoderma noxium]